MKISLMDIKKQHENHAAEYEEAALRVLRSGRYIGGDEVSAFEEEFAAYEGAKYGISCGNGTDAIVLALRSLGIGEGDEVITAAWTFFATAESIAAVGAVPVFADVDDKTYCINAALAETAVTEKTKAILLVHFYGNCADMDAFKEICRKHSLYLITDCAQAAGSRYKGSRKNILGDVSCFSFFPTKNLGGAGDGGMVLTDDEDTARICRALKVHASGKDGLWAFKRAYEQKGKTLPEGLMAGETKYHNYFIGYNSRLDALQAAILREKLKYLEQFINARRENARFYSESLKDTDYILPAEQEYTRHSYYLYVIRHPKAQIIRKGLEKAGIGCGVYYPVPVHLQGAFVKLGYKKGSLSVTESLAENSFAIPVYPELEENEKNYIVSQLKSLS